MNLIGNKISGYVYDANTSNLSYVERELTAEEIAKIEAENKMLEEQRKNTPPTEADRLEAVEMAILELAEVLTNG